jgi:hypothetical protein
MREAIADRKTNRPKKFEVVMLTVQNGRPNRSEIAEER